MSATISRFWKDCAGARFSKIPVTFRARNQIFKSKYKKIRARVLANKLLHFVSLTHSFIMLDAKLLKPLSCMKTTTALRAC